MFKFLGAAGGVELALIMVLGAASIGGGSYVWGRVDGAEICKGSNAEAGGKLDAQSFKVSVDTEEILGGLKEGIDSRVKAQTKINTDEIESTAKTVGKLEGQAEGYIKGFEDAKDLLKNTCFTDPAYLPDGMRDGAIARYEAIFGSAVTADGTGKKRSSEPVFGYPRNNAPEKPSD